MPLFGFRKDKKHEQSHIQAEAGLAKGAAPKAKKPRAAKSATTKTSARVSTKDAGATKAMKNSMPALHSSSETSSAAVIIRPRITEKSGLLSQSNAYTFEVAKHANKQTVSQAVRTLYKVVPVKVTMINTPTKTVIVKNKKGTVSGIRKAIVTLKQGDKIDFV